jgi:hypothetical protein
MQKLSHISVAALTLLATTASFAQSSQPASVEQWGIFEQRLDGPRDGNPFLDVQLSAKFTNSADQKTLTIEGFYDGDGAYLLRFMPEQQGAWHFETTSNRPELNGKIGDFTCSPPAASIHGPVRVANTYHFAYADGTPFVAIGTTAYAWWNQTDPIEQATLETLKNSPFNKVRANILPGSINAPYSPYAQNSDGKPDPMRFDPAFFHHLEKRIADIGAIGVEAEPILFNPYKKGKLTFFDRMDNAGDDRYIAYLVDRLAPYRNIWWSMANEYGQVKGKTDTDWDHFFQTLKAHDPYNHLLSIHNAAKFYDSNKPWITHASIQNGSAVADFGRAVLYRELWPKPVMYDEICYEGNINKRWGQLSGEEMTKRYWLATIAGTYVGHGETFSNPKNKSPDSAPATQKSPDADDAPASPDRSTPPETNPDKVSWTGSGGRLHGSSPARIAFLRKVLESGPREGVEPIDEYYDTNIGGKAGEYYLVYFGEQTPASWTFSIPPDPPAKRALAAGMHFHIDILDTWNLTITPVDRDFVTAPMKGSYYLAQGDGKIDLPGKKYIALRIVRTK